MLTYALVALIHLLGVTAFQYTGVYWFLMLPAIHGVFSVVMFMIASSFLLSGPDSEIKYEPQYEHVGIRLLAQLSLLVTSYQLYDVGYEFISGIIAVASVSLIIMLYYIKIKEVDNVE